MRKMRRSAQRDLNARSFENDPGRRLRNTEGDGNPTEIHRLVRSLGSVSADAVEQRSARAFTDFLRRRFCGFRTFLDRRRVGRFLILRFVPRDKKLFDAGTRAKSGRARNVLK